MNEFFVFCYLLFDFWGWFVFGGFNYGIDLVVKIVFGYFFSGVLV